MRNAYRLLFVFLAGGLICSAAAHGQDDDSPSLGDVARQTRQQRQLKDAPGKSAQAADSPSTNAGTKAPNGTQNSAPSKDAQSRVTQSKDASSAPPPGKNPSSSPTAKKVVTNEEISDHAAPVVPTQAASQTTADGPESGDGSEKASPDSWREKILAQKNAISQLEGQIQDLSDSIRYAGGNCVSNCQPWNEQQQRKQQQVESMTSQLGEQQKRLEQMQEQARRQGYGSSVYDP